MLPRKIANEITRICPMLLPVLESSKWFQAKAAVGGRTPCSRMSRPRVTVLHILPSGLSGKTWLASPLLLGRDGSGRKINQVQLVVVTGGSRHDAGGLAVLAARGPAAPLAGGACLAAGRAGRGSHRRQVPAHRLAQRGV